MIHIAFEVMLCSHWNIMDEFHCCKRLHGTVLVLTYRTPTILCAPDPYGSISLWASWICIRIPNLFVRTRIRILLSTSKKWRKTLKSTVLWLLYEFLFLKNDVNVPSKMNKHKNLLFFVGILKVKVKTKRAGSGAGSASGSVSQRYRS